MVLLSDAFARRINYDDRPNALCRRWVHSSARFAAGPRFLPDNNSLDDDHVEIWKATRDTEPAVWQAHARLTRRLKARAKRYRRKLAGHIERYRLDELDRAKREAEREMFELAKTVFETPAATMDEVRLQARMLRSFSVTLGERQDWTTYQAGLFGRQLADSLCRLEAA